MVWEMLDDLSILLIAVGVYAFLVYPCCKLKNRIWPGKKYKYATIIAPFLAIFFLWAMFLSKWKVVKSHMMKKHLAERSES